MRVLLTTHQFFPDFCSGTEVLTLGVARELRHRGHQVSVLTGYPAPKCTADEERFDEYEYDGIAVYRFRHSFEPMGGQDIVAEIEHKNLLAARYFAAILEKERPDIVHFFHLGRIGIAVVDVAIGANIPAFFTPTDFWAICPTNQLLLPGGEMCKGPLAWGGNCVKHVAAIKLLQGQGRRLLEVVPAGVFDQIAHWTAMGKVPRYPMSGEVAALSKRKAFNLARLNCFHSIVSPTRFMSKTLIENGVDSARIEEIPYGIDVGSFNKQALRGSRECFTIGFIGTLARHKGCHLLVEAVNELRDERVLLKIYGRATDYPQYFDELQRLARANRSIEFCGTFPNDRIGEILDGLDVLVVPSVWYENAPLVVFSALAAKCPVVASNMPGLAEIIHDGENGLLFQRGDAHALGVCLQRLRSDQALVSRLSAQCMPPKRMDQYVAELLDLYESKGRSGDWIPTLRNPEAIDTDGRACKGLPTASGTPMALSFRAR